MTLITVTTGSDIVDANDGLISLREAVALAEGSAGEDTIEFDASVSQVILSALGGALVISSGDGVTIDGDANNDGIADVTISGGNVTRILTIEAGAMATLVSVNLVDGTDFGAEGLDGTLGISGSPMSGDFGTNGADGANGANAAGAIYNSGDLTLIRVGLAGNTGYGGAAGYGGYGGNGGSGVSGAYNGQPGLDGGDGGAGGKGGDGGSSGNGGSGAGAIFNASGATLTLQDTGFSNYLSNSLGATYYGGNRGQGGGGGSGARGGTGGYGGAGGNGGYNPSGPGGNGGDGGDAGLFGYNGYGGNGGSAAGAIVNFGTINVATGAAIDLYGAGNTAYAGAGGAGGYNYTTTAFGGGGGLGGYGVGFSNATGGYDGSNTLNNTRGLDGVAGDAAPGVVGNPPTGGTVADSIIYIHDTDLVIVEGDEGTTTFNINRTGDLTEDTEVTYTLSGVGGLDASDFEGGVLPFVTVVFSGGAVTQQVTFTVLADDLVELDENFTITLSNLVDTAGGATQGLGTSSVTGTILSDDGVFQLFADTSSTTVLLDSTDFAVVDGSALAGEVIRVVDPSLFGGDIQQLTVTTEDLTVISATPFGVDYTLAAGVIGFTEISPSTSAEDSAFIFGNAAANIIRSGDGFNRIEGADGNDSLYGGANADTLVGGDDNDLLDGGAGNDDMRGGAGNDTYLVNSAGDIIDEVAGDGTADRVLAGVNFTLAADDDIEQLNTNLSTGLALINLTGNGLAQSLLGNAAANLLKGLGGADTLNGLGGADTLDGGTGVDVMNGGADSDTYVVDNAGDLIGEVAGGGTADRVLAAVNFTLAADDDIEQLNTNLSTGLALINLTGNGLAQSLLGNAAANLLKGLGGADTLNGLGGADTLDGGLGVDVMNGGADSDTYVVDNAGDLIGEVAGGGTADRVLAGVNFTLAADDDIEQLNTNLSTGLALINLTGNGLAQSLLGNAAANLLKGLGGADTLNGLGGADTLDGGLGADVMNGGAGNDSFVFGTSLSAANVDRIGDFNVADDTIRVDDLVFAGLTAGAVLAATAFASNLTELATDALDRIIYETDTGRLTFDADGTGVGAAVHFATLTPGLGLTNADFFVFKGHSERDQCRGFRRLCRKQGGRNAGVPIYGRLSRRRVTVELR